MHSLLLIEPTLASGATKYDPDLLKSEVDLSRKRVDRLRSELAQIEVHMKYKEMGVESLAQ